jgi:hypothetical protein
LSREPVATARVWDEAFDPELQLLLSPFGWREHWTARNGKRRDSLIFDLADVVVAIDVRADGHIEGECRRAVERGRTVLALDRGDVAAEGARRLWETTPAVRRLAWTGAEAAADVIAGVLPTANMEAAGERLTRGWLREVAGFLCRLSGALAGRRGAAVAGYPDRGVLAEVAQLWTSRGGDRSAGVEALAADLWSNPDLGPGRVTQLLSRVAPGGVLTAVLPAAWLSDERYAPQRADWLENATLRLSVELPPAPDGGGVTRAIPAAVAVLQRGGPARAAQSFTPQRGEVGRFHLRRYLNEVLAAVVMDGGASG